MRTMKICSLFSLLVLLWMGCSSSEDRPRVEKTEDVRLSTSTDTLEHVLSVMRFIAKNADVGNLNNPSCTNFFEQPIESLNVDKFLQIFDTNTGVASCGLVAALMVRILNEKGIDAYSYNFGIRSSNTTHVVVLVPIGGKLQIFDPYVNYWLTGSDGKGIGLEEIFEHQLDTNFVVEYHSNPVTSEYTVYATYAVDLPKSDLSEACKTFALGFKNLNDTIAQQTFIRSYEANRKNECFSLIRKMETNLTSATPLYRFHQAMVLKLNPIKGGKNTDSINLLLDNFSAKAEIERIKFGI